MDTFLFVLEIIGTIAFAVSGAMTGLQKNMDIFGVSILGLTTAVGGGVLRDLILGCTPPATFQDPIYAMLSLAVSIILFLQRIRRLLMRNPEQFNRILLLMDSLGLGAFTTVGIQIAYDSIEAPGAFLLIFVGVVTGVGGGVLRDLMAGNTPYIFVKHVYACASLAGAILCVLLWHPAGSVAAMLSGTLLILLIRGLSAHYRWNLPKAHV